MIRSLWQDIIYARHERVYIVHSSSTPTFDRESF